MNLMIEVRELIEKGWCQRNYCLDSSGEPLPLGRVEEGCSFCLKGAVNTVARKHRTSIDHELKIIQDLLGQLHALLDGSIIDWNDSPDRTKEEVLDLLDKAIRRPDGES